MGEHKQVRVIAIVGIVLSLGTLTVLTVLWFVFAARPLLVRVERRDVVATVDRRGQLTAPAGAGGLAAEVNLGPLEAAAVRPADEASASFDKMQRIVLRGRVAQVTQVSTWPWPVHRVLVPMSPPVGAAAAQLGFGTAAGGGIGPGLSAPVVIAVGRSPQALAVPNWALVRYGRGEFRVRVLRHGEWQMVPVQVGVLGDDYTEIRRGLREGEIVQLTPGVPGAG